MPPFRHKDSQKRGLYTHSNDTVSKASSETKSGRVNTLTTHRNEDPVTAAQDVEIAPDISDEFMQNPLEFADSQLDLELSVEANAESISGISMKAPAKRYLNLDKPLLTWIDYRDTYLDALLEFEG
ncbi:hypothetical protein H0H92_000986 [Tricholoma furcatifolium]|nr:hypothetical protein H0H92_000986 [Tricholoma furcatifolium]